mmetsp:Transcript_68961/g.121948  ORF Transcript_68961/g.121948 Transcript_68961/m.121948 type:complete len:366 (-) Transcript_68961:16-1113(-)
MVVGRIWNFANRHRKKLIAGGIVAGGAYYAWKVWLPRVQQRLLENLLKEITNDQDLGGGKSKAEEAKEKFQHQQRVADDFARKGLPSYLAKHSRCFNLDGCHAKVKEATTKDAKLSALADLQMECLSIVVSALYSLHALLLLQRVQFNIVGREMAAVSVAAEGSDAEAPNSEMAAVATEFIEASDYFLEHGPGLVSSACRKAVQACAASSLAPSTAVTSERLATFFKEVLRSVDQELLGESKGSATLLPPEKDSSGANASAKQQQVKRLLDEARDYAESPQLLEVFRSVTAAAAERVPQFLGSAALQEAGSVPLAKLFGNFISLSKSLLGQEDENELSPAEALIADFGCSAVVNELCEGLFVQTR